MKNYNLYRLIIFSIILFSGCKFAKQIIIQEQYFEEFKKKKITEGHYGGYYILDGKKRVYKLKISNHDEIIIESDFEEGQVVYSDRDFLKNIVILYKEGKVYRVVKGNLNIYKKKDKIQVKINVWGIKDMWELVSNSIAEVGNGKHQKLIFEGEIKLKKADN